jgi:hypothetical protein
MPRARVILAPLLSAAILIGAAGGCKKVSKGAAPGASKPAVQAPVGIPKAVTGYLGLRNPQSSLDDLLGIVREFAPFQVPIDRNGILDLLTQRAHLPMDLLATLDASGTFWMLVLDERQLGERDPGVLVFPLRSRQELEAVLEKRMQKAGTDGDLTLYTPRAGAVGLRELRLHFLGDRHLVVPSSRRAHELCLPFIQRNLIGHPPSYDLALHILTENLAGDPRRDLQKQLDRALARVRAPQGSSSSIDRAPVAAAAEEALRYYGEVLRSTREVIVTADVDPSQVTLAVRAEAKPGGVLHKLIARQHPGGVFGKELLPGSTWLVLSNRSNPEAAAERQKSFATTVRNMFRKLEPKQAERFQAALLELGKRVTGDLTLAAHRAPSGTGLTITALAEVKGDKAREAMESLADVAGDWARQEMRKEQDPTLRDLKVVRRPFSREGAKGSSLSVALHYPEARRAELTKMLGARVGLAWAFKGDTAIVCMGKEAEEQLAALVDAAVAGKLADGLAETSAFRRAQNASPTRIGMLYFSPLDLARWFESSGLPDADAVTAPLKKATVASAPSLDWGVNATRTQLDVTLHLPVEHFRAFKPVLDALMKKRAADGAKSPWPAKAEKEPP